MAEPQGKIVVITGPSGVGKGTVVQRLIADVPKVLKSVSVTTRERRANEQEGVDYFFVDKAKFDEMVKQNAFLEWAEFAGACYGTPKKWVDEKVKAGFDVLLEIEVQGAMQVKDRCPSALLLFLSPPSLEELESRLRGRATETPEKIALRLSKASDELKQKHHFHYEVVNDNLEEAVSKLIHIVKSERSKMIDSHSLG